MVDGAANDLAARAGEVQELVGDDRIVDAIKRLMDLLRDFSDNRELVQEVIVLSAKYKRLEKAERQRTLTYDELERQRTPMLFQVLQIVDQVSEQPRVPAAS
jgi:hypothetical protein